VRVQKAVDPDVAALLDDSDLSRFGSDVEDLEEDFVLQANIPEEEEDVEVEVDKRLNRVEEFGVTKTEVDKSDQQQNMDGLVFQNGIGNHLVVGGDECVGEKPRVRRFLDEQFDLVSFFSCFLIVISIPFSLFFLFPEYASRTGSIYGIEPRLQLRTSFV
jgi:protein LTV1